MAAQAKNEELIQAAKELGGNIPWCEEYEKMISGMLYNCLDPTLQRARFRVRGWCTRYNTWWPHDVPDADLEYLATERAKQLREVVGEVGDDVYLEPPLFLDYGCNIRLGERIYANFNLTILDCSLVTIGNRVMFGPNVSIFAATHETDVQSRRDNIEFARPVTIGDDCWIGGSCVILPGVTIGEGCTVGAGSVVTKDVPAWSVVHGSPARVVKKVTPLDPLPADRTAFTAMERMG